MPAEVEGRPRDVQFSSHLSREVQDPSLEWTRTRSVGERDWCKRDFSWDVGEVADVYKELCAEVRRGIVDMECYDEQTRNILDSLCGAV